MRGPVGQIRSDSGTNFTGMHNELEATLKKMDQKLLEAYLNAQGFKWIFNPPHASHMGGVWECMIGNCHRILDAMFTEMKPTRLTHKVLSTLMAEVAATVNNRPLMPVSNNPSAPEILTPSTLLTQKTDSWKLCSSRPLHKTVESSTILSQLLIIVMEVGVHANIKTKTKVGNCSTQPKRRRSRPSREKKRPKE